MNGEVTLRARFVTVAALLLLLSAVSWRTDRYYEPWEVDRSAQFVQPTTPIRDLPAIGDPDGSLVLAIHVDRDGVPVRVRRERFDGSNETLVESIAVRLLGSRFAPALLGGRPVASIVRLSLNPDAARSSEAAPRRIAGSPDDETDQRVR